MHAAAASVAQGLQGSWLNLWQRQPQAESDRQQHSVSVELRASTSRTDCEQGTLGSSSRGSSCSPSSRRSPNPSPDSSSDAVHSVPYAALAAMPCATMHWDSAE